MPETRRLPLPEALDAVEWTTRRLVEAMGAEVDPDEVAEADAAIVAVVVELLDLVSFSGPGLAEVEDKLAALRALELAAR